MKANVIDLFPVPLYVGEIDVSDADRAYCKPLWRARSDHDQLRVSIDPYVMNNIELSVLKQAADRHLDNYIENVIGISQERARFFINTSWYTEMAHGTYVPSHTHPNSMYSGVIVLDSTEDTRMVFDISRLPAFPPMFQYQLIEYNQYNMQIRELAVKPGQILLFPSHMGHTAKCFAESGKFDILVFDTFIKGELGVGLNMIKI